MEILRIVRKVGAIVLTMALLAQGAFANTFRVDALGDQSDVIPANGICATGMGTCTLRAAIQEADAFAGADIISMEMSGTISPTTELPDITEAVEIDGNGPLDDKNVTVNGDSVPAGHIFHVLGTTEGTVNIHDFEMISGASATSAVKIENSTGVTIDHNVIGGNQDGIEVAGTTSGATISNNYIGVASDGISDARNTRNGIYAEGGGTHSFLTVSENVIGYNTNSGIGLTGDFPALDIRENKIGISGNVDDPIDPADEIDIGNGGYGLSLTLNGTVNTGDIFNNTISGNGDYGLYLHLHGDLSGFGIYGNKIGTNSDGTMSWGNDDGVAINWDVDPGELEELDPFIFGDPLQDPNIISGNGGYGISIVPDGAFPYEFEGTIEFQNNYIGTSAEGDVAIPNNGVGISSGETLSYMNIIVGGDGENEGNIISGNGTYEINIPGAKSVVIQGNKIGVDGTGDNSLANGGMEAVSIDSAFIQSVSILDNVITTYGEGNDNINIGTIAEGDGFTPNVIIQGNYIGIGNDGVSELGGGGVTVNDGYLMFGGVNELEESDSSDIGNGNVVSCNTGGLSLIDNVTRAEIYGNIFGLKKSDVMGEYDTNCENSSPSGLYVEAPKLYSLIIGGANVGGPASERRNVFSGLDLDGVNSQDKIKLKDLCDYSAQDGDENYCEGTNLDGVHMSIVWIGNNFIGTTFSGEAMNYGQDIEGLDLSGSGIVIEDGDDVETGSGGSEDFISVIGGMPEDGIQVFPFGVDDGDLGIVKIFAGMIGLNAAGDSAVPNLENGIMINDGNVFVGYAGPEGFEYAPGCFFGAPNYNGAVISGNKMNGIYIDGRIQDGEDNFTNPYVQIVHNLIGLNMWGDEAIPNAWGLNVPEADPPRIGAGITVGPLSDDATVIIGGDADDEWGYDRNVISGNYGFGVLINYGTAVQVVGNYISLNGMGNSALPNMALDPVLAAQSIFSVPDGMNGSGIGVIDFGWSSEFGDYQSSIVSPMIRDNYISGNEASGISIYHQPNTGEIMGDYTVMSGLGQDWTDGYIKDNVFGFAIDGTTSVPNGEYGIYVEDTEGESNITNLMIGGSNNNFETETNYGIYLLEIIAAALSGGYEWLMAHNDFSNLDNAWQALVAGVEQNVPEAEECTSFTYSDWSSCSNGLQTRTVVTSSPEGCEGGSPILSQSCSSGGGTLIIPPPPPHNPPPENPPPGEDEEDIQDDEEVVEEPEIKEPEKKVEEAVSTVEDTVVDLVVGTETGVKTEVTAEVTTEEAPLPPPTEISEVDTNAVYSSPTYASQALALIVSGSPEKATEELKQVYGFEKVQEVQTEEEKQIIEKELGDAVVFGKKPGEVVTVPRISNLNGTVGSNPAILALSKLNEKITVEFSKTESKTTKQTKKQSTPIITITGETDDEGKAVLNTLLSDGEYSATIYTTRNGNKIIGKTIKFTVDQSVDQEFKVQDLTITEENVHEPYIGEAGDLVTFLLSYLEKFDPNFIAQDYVEFSRTGGIVYVVQGRVDTLDNTNKMVYLAYQSITFGSAVISDASQKGSFKTKLPKKLAIGQHKLTVYAYDPKQSKSTSLKTKTFNKK